MRARDIKPGFFKNDQLAECSMAARLLFPGLWMLADREGRIENRPRKIKAEIFPFDDLDVADLLSELEKAGLIRLYEVNGTQLIWIPQFRRHQNPHKNEKLSELPAHPDDLSATCPVQVPCDSGTAPEKERVLPEHSGTAPEITEQILLTPSSLTPEYNITTPNGVVVDAVGVSPLPERDGQAEESSQDASAGEEHAGQVAASSLPPAAAALSPASPPVCPLPSPAGKEYTGEYAQGNDALLFFPGGGLSTHGENLPGNSPERAEKAFCDQLLMSGKSKPLKSKFGESGCPPCPHERILAAYHEALPELPSVKVWDGTRKSHLQARWRERWKAGKYASQTDGVAYWTRLFRHVRTCDWLMGRVTGRDGRAFKASLGWLVRPENFAKLIEGRYDRQEVAA